MNLPSFLPLKLFNPTNIKRLKIWENNNINTRRKNGMNIMNIGMHIIMLWAQTWIRYKIIWKYIK